MQSMALDEEQGTGARKMAGKTREVVLSSPRPGRTREVVMVTDMETGQKTIQMRVADGVSEREGLESRNVYGGAGEEQEACRADPATGEQAEKAPWSGKEGQDQ